jgi:hypothetical protein
MKKIIYLMSVGLLFAFTACKKDAGPAPAAVNQQASQGKASIKLMSTACASIHVNTPEPTAAAKAKAITGLNVDIQRIMLYSETKGWIDLKLTPGVYDLVALQNNASVYLTEQTSIDAGEFKQLYIYFGGNNSIMVNGAKKCMRLKSSALTIDLNAIIKSGTLNEIILGIDFCDALSVDPTYDSECYIFDPSVFVKGSNEIAL